LTYAELWLKSDIDMKTFMLTLDTFTHDSLNSSFRDKINGCLPFKLVIDSWSEPSDAWNGSRKHPQLSYNAYHLNLRSSNSRICSTHAAISTQRFPCL